METRVLKVLTDEDIQKLKNTVFSWKTGDGYEDIEGYCKSSTTDEIEKNDFILTPGRYVGFADEDDDDRVPFDEKMKNYTNSLNKMLKERSDLDQKIMSSLKKIGS